jgi:hypothetical protein
MHAKMDVEVRREVCEARPASRRTRMSTRPAKPDPHAPFSSFSRSRSSVLFGGALRFRQVTGRPSHASSVLVGRPRWWRVVSAMSITRGCASADPTRASIQHDQYDYRAAGASEQSE